MGERWTDRDEARRRTPEQRAADARASDSTIDLDTQCALDKLEDTIAEQSAIITGQRAAIEALREMVEDLAQGGRHLAGRIDELCRRFNGSDSVPIEQARTLDRFEAFKKRVVEAVPSVGKRDIQEQCDAVEFRGPQEEGDRE
jgi:hypothetical protein